MAHQAVKTYPSRSLHGSIVHELGKRIVSGRYLPGGTLPIEEDLRAELDVSRNALREAIKVLSAKGLLSVKTRTGTTVQPRDRWHLTDPDVLSWSMAGEIDRDVVIWLTEFRSVIEPAAAEMAAARASSEERRAIGERMREFESACRESDGSEQARQVCIDADMAFHGAIFSAAGNPLLETVVSNISSALALSRVLTGSVPGASLRSLPLHLAIGRAVVEGRSSDAKAAMIELCKSVAEDVESALGSEVADESRS